jgi:hypothetical protein
VNPIARRSRHSGELGLVLWLVRSAAARRLLSRLRRRASSAVSLLESPIGMRRDGGRRCACSSVKAAVAGVARVGVEE